MRRIRDGQNYDRTPFPMQADDPFDSLCRMDPDDLEDICYDGAKELGITTQNQFTALNQLVDF